VTWGSLPQRAGSPSLNGGLAAAAVPSAVITLVLKHAVSSIIAASIVHSKLDYCNSVSVLQSF